MEYQFKPIENSDGEACLAILNHYIASGPAAFFQTPLPLAAAGTFLGVFKGYPNAAVKDDRGHLVGFGFLRAYSQIPTFSRTAEISYFLAPEATGKGLGSRLLDHLEAGARDMGIRTILASIASENEGSLRFHEKHGFVRCGLLKGVYEKNGRVLDVVVMQKQL